MKNTYLLTSILCLLSALAFGQKPLMINPKNCIVHWTGHAEIGNYSPRGTIELKSGEIYLNSEGINTASIVMDMKSMNQENDHLISHLKSEDFFDVERYPLSTIKIIKVDKDMAYGQLKIKDKILPIHFPISIRIEGSQWTISGSLIIDRTKYGIIYNSGNFFSGLGDKAIRNTFDIDFNLIVKTN